MLITKGKKAGPISLTATVKKKVIRLRAAKSKDKKHKFTNFYRNTADDFATASLLEQVPGYAVSDDDTLPSGDSFFYWVTYVDDDSNESLPYPAVRGVEAVPNSGGIGDGDDLTVANILAAADDARSLRKFVTGYGVLEIDNTINLETVNVDLLNMKIIATAPFADTIMIDIGGNGQNSETLTKRAYAWGQGDGTVVGDADDILTWSVTKTLTGFRINNDDGAATYDLRVSNLNVGVLVYGNSEKNNINVTGTYCNTVVKEDEHSPDTNRYRINGQSCVQWFVSADDSTFNVDFNCESRIDTGATIVAGYNGAINIPLPAVVIKNGKHAKLSGEFRAANGRVNTYVDRDGTDNGADTVTFNNLSHVHMYGTTLLIDRCSRVRGHILVKDSDNGRFNQADETEPPIILMPAIKINRVYSAGGFACTIEDCNNASGLSIGDVTKGLFPVDVDFANLSVSMRTLDRDRGLKPTGKTAFEIEKALRCTFVFNEINGNVSLLAGCQDSTIAVPSSWLMQGYSVSKHVDATAKLIIKGPVRSARIFFKSWLFDGVTVENLIDYDGASATYRNGRWNFTGPQIAQTDDGFDAISASANSLFKRTGLMVFDTVNDVPMFAQGTALADPWKQADGTGSVTPDYSSRTTALVARMTTPPSTARKLAYDRLYYALDQAGVLPKLILLYMLGAHEKPTAKLNLITGLVAGPYDLTEHNAPAFTIDRGFMGNGASAYLSSGFNAQSQAEGMTINSAHIGAFVLNLGTNSNGPNAGSQDGNLRVRYSGGASSRVAVSNSTALSFSAPDAPAGHICGVRTASGVEKAYINGAVAATGAIASASLPNDFDILRGLLIGSSVYSAEQNVFAVHVGLGLTAADVLALSDAIYAFAAEVGAV